MGLTGSQVSCHRDELLIQPLQRHLIDIHPTSRTPIPNRTPIPSRRPTQGWGTGPVGRGFVEGRVWCCVLAATPAVATTTLIVVINVSRNESCIHVDPAFIVGSDISLSAPCDSELHDTLSHDS